jgi:hypothetical protein
MAMNQFEELLIEHCRDVPRIISETIQLENYIFKHHEIIPQQNLVIAEEPSDDLDLSMNILPELAE